MKAWEIVSDVLKLLSKEARIGVTTQSLNDIGEKKIIELGGIPVNKGYLPPWAKTPYPASICISINDEIVHGIPGNRVLENGDIVNFDLGVEKDGECGDAALSMGIGEISNRDERLLYYAKKTLEEAIKIIKPEVLVKDISKVIELFATTRGFLPNRNFGGHGIKENMHQEPWIPNTTFPETLGSGERALRVRDRICIEPILTFKDGDDRGVLQDNGWTVKTRDGKKSAYFEHMLEVVEGGHKILTTHI